MEQNLKTINIKGKEYVEVNERINYFRTNAKYENWSLETEVIELNDTSCTLKAVIKDANGIIKATGLAWETRDSSMVNSTSYVENCETSAWGRALANLGIGIKAAIASADEVTNAIKQQQNNIQNNPQNFNPDHFSQFTSNNTTPKRILEKTTNLELEIGEIVEFTDQFGQPVNYVFKYSKKNNSYFFVLFDENDEVRSPKYINAVV